MSDNTLESIGVKFDTTDVDRGIRSLADLAQKGPEVEKSLDGVEKSAKTAAKSLADLKPASQSGIAPIATDAPKAADGLERMGKSAQEAARSMASASASADFMASVLKGAIGAVSIEALRRTAMGFYEEADALGKLAKTTGIAVEQLSGLAEVGRYSGQGAQSIGGAAKYMAKALAETTESGSGAAAALRALGIGLNDFKRLAPDQQMVTVAKAMAGFEDGAGKSAVAMKLMGRSGADMIPFLDDLASKGIASAAVTTRMAEESAAFNDALEMSGAAMQNFGRSMAMALLPDLQNVLTISGKLKEAFSEYLRGSADDAKGSIDGLGIALGAIGTTMETVAVIGANVAYVLHGVGTEIGGLVAQASAARRGDFAGVDAIGAAMKADAETARAKLDAFDRSVIGVTDRMLQLRASARDAGQGLRELAADASGAGRKPLVFDDGGRAATKELANQAKLIAELSGLSGHYAADLRMLQQVRAAGNISEERYIASVEKLIAIQPFAIDLQKRSMAQAREWLSMQELREAGERQIAEAEASAQKAREMAIDSYAKTLDNLRDEAAAADLAAVANLTHAQAIARVTLSRLEDERVRLVNDPAELAALERKITLQRQIIATTDQAAAREANTKAAQDAAEAWRRTADSIGDGLTEAFRTALDSGENFGTAFAKSIGKQVRAQVIGALSQAMSTQVLLPALFGSTGASGSSTNWVGLANNASTLYSAGNIGGLSGSALAAGNYASVYSGSAYGTAFGSQQSAMLAAQESGMVSSAGSASMGSAASYAGWIALAVVAAMEASSDWSAGLRREQSRDTNTALGDAAARTAQLMDDLGVSDRWADILSGATLTARIGKELGLLATPHMGGYALATAAGVEDITRQQGGIQDAAMQDLIGSFTADTLKLIGGFASSMGTTSNVSSVRSVFESDNNDPSWGLFHLMNEAGGRVAGFDALGTLPSSAAEGFAEYTKQAAGSIVDALTQIDIPKWAKTQLEALGGDIDLNSLSIGVAEIVTHEKELNALTASMRDLGPAFQLIDAASSDTIQSLADMAGGLDQFTASLSSYVQNYYSEAERTSLTMGAIGKTLADVGLEMPGTRDAFRGLVDSLDPTTEAGQQAYAALMSVADAFAAVTPSVDDLARAAAGAAADIAKAAAKIADQRQNLQMQIWEAIGDQTAINAYNRSLIDESNLDLYDELLRIKTEQAAAAAATQATQAWQEAGSVAVDAADSTKQLLESAAQSIADEVTRLRGDIGGNEAASYAQLQAQFAIGTAKARAGDADAAGGLSGLSKSMTDAGVRMAGSGTEADILRASTAASLSSTLSIMAAQTGSEKIVAAVQALQARVQTMEQTLQETTGATATHVNRMANDFESALRGGRALTVIVENP